MQNIAIRTIADTFYVEILYFVPCRLHLPSFPHNSTIQATNFKRIPSLYRPSYRNTIDHEYIGDKRTEPLNSSISHTKKATSTCPCRPPYRPIWLLDWTSWIINYLALSSHNSFISYPLRLAFLFPHFTLRVCVCLFLKRYVTGYWRRGLIGPDNTMQFTITMQRNKIK